MDSKEVIILAGGMGTRLRNTIGEIPKCLALVNGKPFLHYQIQYLVKQGFSKFIFSLGYKSEMVIDYILKEYSHLNFKFSVEIEPLGTGGAIKKSIEFTKSKMVLIVNGDTFFNINLDKLYYKANKFSNPFTIALFRVKKNLRYGYVSVTENHKVSQFHEKKEAFDVLVNSGFYLIDKSQISFNNYPISFSLENFYFDNAIKQNLLYSVEFDSDFIDIGVPEDFINSQIFFKK